jgi:hypothetical protein
VEVQQKEIADVIRGRIAVEKTVAEEEERIKDTRAIAEAKRSKEVQVTAAEAEAEEQMVKTVKAAEAQGGGAPTREGEADAGRRRPGGRRQAPPRPRSGWPRASRPRWRPRAWPR